MPATTLVEAVAAATKDMEESAVGKAKDVYAHALRGEQGGAHTEHAGEHAVPPDIGWRPPTALRLGGCGGGGYYSEPSYHIYKQTPHLTCICFDVSVFSNVIL